MSKDTFIPNSYQTPNAYCDRLMYLLTPAEWKILSYAIRRIFGFEKRKDYISLSQFHHGTTSRKRTDGEPEQLDHGTGLSKPTIIAGLDALIKYRLIYRLEDNDPIKNYGDLYALQLDYEKVDYAGLIERANDRVKSDLNRTASGRNNAERKRRSIPLDLPGQSDLLVPVNPIDKPRSIPLTRGGKSVLPAPVNPIDTQSISGNTEEIQKVGISHPDFEAAGSILQAADPAGFESAAPVLLEVDEHPNRMRIRLAAVPAGFMDAFKVAFEQVTRRRWALSFETPGTGQAPEQRGQATEQGDDKEEAAPQPTAQAEAIAPADAELWQMLKDEIGQYAKPTIRRDMIDPARLVSANGQWTIAVPDAAWWQVNIAQGLGRIYRREQGKAMTFVFIQENGK